MKFKVFKFKKVKSTNNTAIRVLKNTNTDFINCTRMIYPQQDGAMKLANFIGNSIFANLFSLLFKKKITDTLCGTKIFFKKDWEKTSHNSCCKCAICPVI